MPKEITLELTERVISLYLEGLGSNTIQDILGLNRYYVYKILKDNNIEIRNKKQPKGKLLKLWPQILEMYDLGYSCSKIGRELNICHDSVTRILKKNGLDTERFISRRERPLIDDIDEILEKYNSGWSTKKLGKYFECAPCNIWQLLIKNGTETRGHRIYDVNHNFFEKIDNEINAFVTGLWFTDGNVKKDVPVSRIGMTDFDIIDKIIESLGYTGPCRITQPTGKGTKPIKTVEIYSPKIKEDLINLGCIPNKSLVLNFPKSDLIPDKFIRHFIRGCLDGDGCITFNKNSKVWNVIFVGTKNMLEGILEKAKKLAGIEKGFSICKSTKTSKNTYHLSISREHGLKFLNWIYEDSLIHMDRKYYKYLEMKSFYEIL